MSSEKKNISLIAHSKCGYSLKQIDAIKDQGFDKDIDVVYCDVKSPGEVVDERCSEVSGFPTFYSGKKKIHVGYTKDLNSVLVKQTADSTK